MNKKYNKNYIPLKVKDYELKDYETDSNILDDDENNINFTKKFLEFEIIILIVFLVASFVTPPSVWLPPIVYSFLLLL